MPPRDAEVAYEAYVHLIRQLDGLIESFEQHPDEATRERVFALLTGIDMLHHEGLGRLVTFFRNQGASEYLDFALQDPVIHTLFGLYGLSELELPPERVEPRGPGPLVQLTVNGKPAAPTHKKEPV